MRRPTDRRDALGIGRLHDVAWLWFGLGRGTGLYDDRSHDRTFAAASISCAVRSRVAEIYSWSYTNAARTLDRPKCRQLTFWLSKMFWTLSTASPTRSMSVAVSALLARGDGMNLPVENGSPDLMAEAVVGRQALDYITGEDVRAFYRQRVEEACTSGEAVIVLSRCDSPSVRRELRLAITPLMRNGATELVLSSRKLSTRQSGLLSIFSIQRSSCS